MIAVARRYLRFPGWTPASAGEARKMGLNSLLESDFTQVEPALERLTAPADSNPLMSVLNFPPPSAASHAACRQSYSILA